MPDARPTDHHAFAAETVTFRESRAPGNRGANATLLAGYHVPTDWRSSTRGLAQGNCQNANGTRRQKDAKRLGKSAALLVNCQSLGRSAVTRVPPCSTRFANTARVARFPDGRR